MTSVMDKRRFCSAQVLLLTGVIPLVLAVIREYHLIQQARNWSDAQTYCRSNFDDLATIETANDIIKLQDESQLYQFNSGAWIGLYTNLSGWHWTLGDEPLSEVQWNPERPFNKERECVMASYFAGWWDTTCDDVYAFTCYDETYTGNSRYIFYSAIVTWHEARRYCRQHHTDLACGKTSAENSIILQTMDSSIGFTWIGLFREPWKWSDGTNMSIVCPWMTGSPDNTQGNENCGYLMNSQTSDVQCANAMPFFCQKILYPRIQQSIKVKVSSNQDVNDPAVKAAILEKIKQKLEVHGMCENTTVKWKEKPNRDIFTKKRNYKASQKCDL